MDVVAEYGSGSESDNDADAAKGNRPLMNAAQTQEQTLAASEPLATGLGTTTRTVTVTRKGPSTYVGAGASVHELFLGTARFPCECPALPLSWHEQRRAMSLATS